MYVGCAGHTGRGSRRSSSPISGGSISGGRLRRTRSREGSGRSASDSSQPAVFTMRGRDRQALALRKAWRGGRLADRPCRRDDIRSNRPGRPEPRARGGTEPTPVRAIRCRPRRSTKGEHLLKRVGNLAGLVFRQMAHASDQPRFVHCTYLIQDDLPLLVLKLDVYPCRVVAFDRRHWRDNHCSDVPIHFVRRDNDARAGFSDLSTARRVEADEMNAVTTDRRHHSHSVSSQSLMASSGTRRVSSPMTAIFLKAASQF